MLLASKRHTIWSTAPAVCEELHSYSPWSASEFELSLGGASLVSDQPVEPRHTVPGILPRPKHAPRLSERARDTMRLRHFSPRKHA